MGALGDLVSNAVDAYSGTSSGTTLQSFLDKFSSSSGRYVDTLDPLGTFDVRFRFHPTLTAAEIAKKGGSALGRVASSLVNSLKSMGTQALDNLTGGLFSSLTEGGSGSVMKARKDFKEAGSHTFMEYLAPANLLQGGEQWTGSDQANCPLDLNLGPYVQSIKGLNMKMSGEAKAQTMFGDFPVAGPVVQAEGSLTMEVVNTKAALHERIFYPWLRECSLPYWSYERQPYTTATVDIDFTKHSDMHYVFVGVRPVQLKLMDASQDPDPGNLVREVIFAYDYMFVTSDLNVNDSWTSKLAGSAGALMGGASKMLNV
jgi:hypothetical protein